jgi:glycosyltransferase involved in cell wall biosynthesis
MRWAADTAGRLSRRPPPHFQAASQAIRQIARSGADIIHLHGTHLHLNHALLRRALGKTPIVLHYHGGFAPRSTFIRSIHRQNLATAARVLLTDRSQVENLGGVREEVIREVIETSSTFAPASRDKARRDTGMHGCPVYLSACRLHPIKDPLTTLKAFEQILTRQPEAQLYHFYTSSELLEDLKTYVDARPALRKHVHFRGRMPRLEMEAVYNSADFFLQASTREFSGCALLEAMACGVIPVVTDIPPFRRIVGDAGLLFGVGIAAEMADAALSVPPEEVAARSGNVRRHFEKYLSFDAMAERLEEIYGEVVVSE